MNTRTLTVLAIALGLMNPAAALLDAAEHGAHGTTAVLAAWALPWLAAAALLRSGRVTAGAIVAGVLALFDLVNAPTWTRTTIADWTTQSIAVLAAAACLVLALVILVRHFRTSARLSGVAR